MTDYCLLNGKIELIRIYTYMGKVVLSEKYTADIYERLCICARRPLPVDTHTKPALGSQQFADALEASG